MNTLLSHNSFMVQRWVSRKAGRMMFKAALVSTLSIAMLAAASAAAAPPPAAIEAYQRGELQKALSLLPAGVTDAEQRLLRGKVLLERKRYREAAVELASLEGALPQLRDAIFLLQADAAMGQGYHAEAAQLYRQTVLVAGSRWVDLARERLGHALLAARQFPAARLAFRRLLRSDDEHPRRPALELGLAQAERALGLRKAAAKRLRELWLSWPESDAAARGQVILAELTQGKRRVKLEPLPVTRLFDRAEQLYRAKRWDDAVAQLREIGKRFPVQSSKAAWRIAWTTWKAGRIEDSRKALASLLVGKSVSWKRLARSLEARCLARSGQVDAALALYSADLPRDAKQRLLPVHRRALSEVGRLQAEHGRYREALASYDRLAGLLTWSRPLKRKTAWLAYRAGQLDRAIKAFKGLYGNTPFSLYWRARAHDKAGRPAVAEALYRQLLERHLRNYYGQLARSRLVEKGKVALAAGTCSSFQGVARAEVVPLLDALIGQYAAQLPELIAARTLWRAGLRTEARRHLRLALLDYTWAVYRGRATAFNIRQRPLRLWRGGTHRVLPRGQRARELRAARAELGPELGQLAYAAGLDYFGWRLAPRDGDRTRHYYPRAWAPLVVATARRFDLDPNMLWAIMRTESAYRSDVISRVNAGGLMQLMPNTARRLAAELKLPDFSAERVFEPRINLLLAGQYLRAVWRKLRGQLPLVAAAYNGGPHNVARWLDARGKVSALDEFIEEIPYDESRRYAKKIVRLQALYERTYCNKDDLVLPLRLDATYLPHPNY